MLFFSLIVLLVMVFAGLIFTLRQVMVTNAVAATRHLEELGKKLAEKETEVDQRMAKIDEESAMILERARLESEGIGDKIIKAAEREKQEIIKEAGVKAEEIIQKAEKSRKMLLLEIESRIEQAAIERAGELVRENLPEKYRRELHDIWCRDIIDGGFAGMERLHLSGDVGEIEVTSAFALDEGQRKGILEKAIKIFGTEMPVTEKVDPKLIAGIVVKAGSLVFDGSLINRMTQTLRGGEENAG